MSDDYQLNIMSLQGNYPVIFLDKIREITEKLNREFEDLYLIVDAKIWSLYEAEFKELCNYPIYFVEVKESNKTLASVERISEWLIDVGATKSSTLVAIGGGMVQDLVTFTAHVYYRGIKWIYLPTTLLSQSDSCIGAKCGLNVLPYKNQLGVIHSPICIIICEQFLKSLTEPDYESGFGEILKLSLTGENEFYQEFKDHLKMNGFSREGILKIIQSSLRAKQAIIEKDEYETDLRRILNYGHSFGHVLESLTGNKIPHGAAIIFGMDLMNYLGVKWGITEVEFYQEFNELVKNYFQEYSIPRDITSERLIRALGTDKKMSHGKMHFAVAVKPGEILIHKCELNQELIELVGEYLSEKTIFNFA